MVRYYYYPDLNWCHYFYIYYIAYYLNLVVFFSIISIVSTLLTSGYNTPIKKRIEVENIDSSKEILGGCGLCSMVIRYHSNQFYRNNNPIPWIYIFRDWFTQIIQKIVLCITWKSFPTRALVCIFYTTIKI